jgi:diacylglycerol kinase (ATP)
MAIASASRYGGGLKTAPAADLKDGLLDACRVAKMNTINVLRLSLPSVFSGSHLRLKEVEYLKTAAVESKPSLEI